MFLGPDRRLWTCGPTTEIYCQMPTGKMWKFGISSLMVFCHGARAQLLNSASSIVLDDLKNKGIDTGRLERLTMIMQGKKYF